MYFITEFNQRLIVVICSAVAARSVVFNAMFEHEMEERKQVDDFFLV